MLTSPRGSIQVNRVWKRFRADQTAPTLAAEASRLRDRLAGRPDDNHWRWVLRDISCSIAPGEAVGLVGTNGSGKSTLLRLLSRVMYPYAGDIRMNGRVGALIEIDAGFHPELTGRENIYLYGSLAGLSDRETRARFDSIVEFAGLESAIDRQVKYYSTGMRMRLGFTVAVSTEPEVLLVDEVLAVGDSSFQARCMARITSAIKDGTTVVLVSHDLLSVQAVCSRVLWIDDGVVKADGPTDRSLTAYRNAVELQAKDDAEVGPVEFVGGSVERPGGGSPTTQGAAQFHLELKARSQVNARVYLGVSQGTAIPIFTMRHELNMAPGVVRLEGRIERIPLARGEYHVWMDVLQDDGTLLMDWQPVMQFNVEGPSLHGAPTGVVRLAPIHVDSDWEV
ncbi:MAG: type transport system ATP-binding protein [Chloroflexota bacterium]|nr:type transport system ATP-binding protein [Chloroflexota bacterium]